MNIGKNIRRLRKACKFTQVQVASQLQVTGSTITESALIKIEGGYHTIVDRDIARLRKIFNCTFEDFFKGIPEN